jgi:acyl-coenzyme A thioesterase PaaI-like protein
MLDAPPQRIRLPWSRSCFVCGEANPQGLRAEIYKVGDLIEMAFVPRRELVGWAGVVHGGLIGTVLDELMTWAAIVQGRRAFFAVEVGVRFKAPLPPECPCLVRARVSSVRRQLVETESWIESADGTLFARGSGRYLPVPADRMDAARHDFVSAQGCLDLSDVFGADPNWGHGAGR